TYSGATDGTHTFSVTATDAARNVSGPASFAWRVDTTPPAVSIATGPPSLTNDMTATFSLSSTKAGSTFSCKLDAREPAPCASPATYTALAEGRHLFTATATDPAGNASAPASSTWTVDTTPPRASIVSGPPSLTNQTSATLT